MSDRDDLVEVFQRACAEHGAATAIVDGDGEVDYAELRSKVAQRARALDSVLGPDTVRVAIQASNSVEYLVTYYALIASGRLPFLVDAEFGAVELEEIRSTCGVAAFLVDDPDHFPLPMSARAVPGSSLTLASTTQRQPERVPEPHPTTVTCRFTSGSTGAPKCLEFSTRAIHNAARNWMTGTGLGHEDRVLCLASFSNGLAFNTSVLPVLLAGAQLHIYRGLPTSHGITRAVLRSRATRLVAFPFAYRVLADASQADVAAFATVRTAISAAAALPAEVRASFENRYRVRIADYYGIAEVGPCTFEPDHRRRAGLGTALPGVTLRTVELPTGEHEIRVRTESMSTEYLNTPDPLRARVDHDGFLRTGDLGRIEDGRLFITGRVGGPINLAGRKVDPTEIERFVRTLDGIQDAVVFLDTDTRADPVVHVVLTGTRCPARGEVLQACRRSLAGYKVPGRVSYLPAIPRSTTGKVRFSELRRLVTEPGNQDGSE
ncbi:class I adenylate-forming enzyme family protein [Actinophytocola sediminis]